MQEMMAISDESPAFIGLYSSRNRNLRRSDPINSQIRGDTELVKLLRTSVEQTSEDDGWAHLSKVGKYISNNSSFSPVNYGYRKLSDLIKASEMFEVEMRNNNTSIYIKDAR